MSKKPSSLSLGDVVAQQNETYNPELKNLLKDVENKSENEKRLVRMNFETPEDLRNDFKAKVAKQGKKVKDVLTAFLMEYVKKEY